MTMPRTTVGGAGNNCAASASRSVPRAPCGTRTMAVLLPEAQRLAAAGLSIIPVGPDKRPLGSWAKNQVVADTPEVLAQRLSSPRTKGCAVVTGGVSGGLFCIDLDADKRREALSPVDPDVVISRVLEVLEPILDTEALAIVQTPSGGYHLYARCPAPEPNTKLAAVPARNRQRKHYFLETRGEHGYVLLPGSEHPSGGAYVLLCGDLAELLVLTQEQYEAAMQALRSLDRTPRMAQPTLRERRLVDTYRQRQERQQPEVIRLYNAAHDPAELLEEAGYRLVRGKYLSPDSSSGNGGVTMLEDGALVYSHHADVLGDGCAHDAFDVYALLEHDGDKKRAYREAKRELGLWVECAPSRRRQATPRAQHTAMRSA